MALCLTHTSVAMESLVGRLIGAIGKPGVDLDELDDLDIQVRVVELLVKASRHIHRARRDKPVQSNCTTALRVAQLDIGKSSLMWLRHKRCR